MGLYFSEVVLAVVCIVTGGRHDRKQDGTVGNTGQVQEAWLQTLCHDQLLRMAGSPALGHRPAFPSQLQPGAATPAARGSRESA